MIGYLHRFNIIHRDIKLENLVFERDGYIKLINFGLAKHRSDESLATLHAGTPEYLAPEILKGKGYDQTVDWWNLGIVMYELLFGVTPFQPRMKQEGEILNRKIKETDPVFPDRDKYKISYSDTIMDLI